MKRQLPTIADSDPRMTAALNEAAAHYRAGRLTESERVCNDFLKRLGPNPHILNTLGATLRNQGRHADAVKAYRESLALAPDNASAWSNLSNALSDLERFEEAVEAGRKALELVPANETYQNNLAKVEARQRQAQPRGPGVTRRLHRARTPRSATHRPKILFVSHEASRTGAPMLLLNFLQWVKANTDITFEILVKGRTDRTAELPETLELMPDFESLGHTMRWYRREGGIHDAENVRAVTRHIEQANYDLVFANTVCNGDVLGVIGDRVQCPIVSYIHELEYSIRCNPARHVANVMNWTTQFIAGSHVVRNNLARQFGMSVDNIEVVPSFINIAEHSPEFDAATIRQQLRISPDAFVVNACATVEWRKGSELFVLLADAIRRRRPERPVHFVWVGAPPANNFFLINFDIQRMNLEDMVHFIGSRPNFRDYIAAADAFALMSREDPFPLVALEAALLQRPILCFDRGGGTGEFVEQDCGFVVPYLDIDAMGERIMDLMKNPGLGASLGRRGAQKVSERHDAAVGSASLWRIIDRILQPVSVEAQ